MSNAKAILLALGLSGLLAGCATPPKLAAACPVGQSSLRTAQLFFGRGDPKPPINEAAFRKFVYDELTPRFPDGLTILAGGGQWKGADERLIRNAAKVVLIVLPQRGDVAPKIEAVRAAYKLKFHQDSVLLVASPTCVAA